MPDINVTIKQGAPVNVTVGATPVTVNMGQVLPVFQQAEAHRQEKFIATAGQAVFALAVIPRTNSLQAFRNGILLGADEYTIVGSTLTTNAGLNARDILDTHYIVA